MVTDICLLPKNPSYPPTPTFPNETNIFYEYNNNISDIPPPRPPSPITSVPSDLYKNYSFPSPTRNPSLRVIHEQFFGYI